MDAESLRSGRSEKSDRSRRPKPSSHTQIQQSSEPSVNTAFNHSNIIATSPDTRMPSTDIHLHSMSPNCVPPVTRPTLYPQGPANQNYSVYNWMTPMGVHMGPNVMNYQQGHLYPPHGWSNQQLPQGYSQQPMPAQFGGLALPMPNQQHPQQLTQAVQPLQHDAYMPVQIPVQQMGDPQAQMVATQHTPRAESYRVDRFEPNHDDTAWVEDATAVTGATSETGLSGGDNFSRFGARYGLANSLGMQLSAHNNHNISGATAALIRAEVDDINPFTCSHIIGNLASTLVGFGALFSPILMLLLPHLPSESIGWVTDGCTSVCEGNLIGISIKLALLTLATFFLSAPCHAFQFGNTTLFPRIRLCRTLFLCLVSIVLFAFWLFYTVRVIQPGETSYISIVLFAGSLTDTMLFLYYAGVGMLKLRTLRQRYAIHIVRSPDGASKSFVCAEMSLQHAALEVIQFYMVNFSAYTLGQCQTNNGASNNYGGNKRNRRSNFDTASGGFRTGGGCGGGSGGGGTGGGGGGSKYKFYDVDGTTGVCGGSGGGGSGMDKANGRAGSAVSYGMNNQSANDVAPLPSASTRLYEELELEKRTRKRRMRLLVAVEEAFTHVKRLANNDTNLDGSTNASATLNPKDNLLSFKDKCSSTKSLDPYEAAQAVFPTLIRPLQKYMRITRQQSRHPVDTVIDHLALCLAYGLSPHAFLERFNPKAVTPQLDAATAASAVVTAKCDKQNQCQQQQQQQQFQPTANDTASLLPKRIHVGGQQAWSIVADRSLSRGLADGAIFQLRRGNEISLLCSVRRLPLIRLVEEVLEPLGTGRFSLNTDGAV